MKCKRCGKNLKDENVFYTIPKIKTDKDEEWDDNRDEAIAHLCENCFGNIIKTVKF